MMNRFALKKLTLVQVLWVFLFSLILSPSLSLANGDSVPAAKKAAAASPKKLKKKKKKTVAKKRRKRVRKKHNNFYVWGTGAFSKGRDNYILSQSRSKSFTGVGGINYQVNRELNLGFNYAHGRSRNRKRVTALTDNSRTTSKPSSFFLTTSYNVTREFGLNFNFGYTFNPSHNRHVSSRTGLVTTLKAKTNIWSYSPSISYTKRIDNFSGRFQWGYAHSDAYRKAATDSNGRRRPKSASHSNSVFAFGVFTYDFKNVSETLQQISPFTSVGIDLVADDPRLRGRDRVVRHRRQEGWKSGAGVKLRFDNDITAIAAWGISGGKSGRLNNNFSVTVRAGLFNL